MKKILLSLLLAGCVQNSLAMQTAGGGQAAESGSRVEGEVPVEFSDCSRANLDLRRLRALNSGILDRILFSADRLSCLGELSEEDKLIVMQEFEDLADFENFEKILKDELSGEIANMVDFCKKAIFLDINTDHHLKGLLARDEAQFFKLCHALLAENEGFLLSMQRVCPGILHHAIRNEDPDFAKMLIEAGADVNAKDNLGWTALMNAARNGRTEIAQLLISSGADFNTISLFGSTALSEAASNGHIEIVRLLIASGADVNATSASSFGFTALMQAAISGHTGTAKLLIDSGANVNAANSYGWTVLELAKMMSFEKMAQLLRDSGAR